MMSLLKTVTNLVSTWRHDAIREEPTAELTRTTPGKMVSSWGELEIRRELGRGSFGVVCLAWDTKLHREVALKLIPSLYAPLNEARSIAGLHHPNIIDIYKVDERDGLVGLQLELIKGVTLEKSLQEHGLFDSHEASLIGADVCRALAAVHGENMLHRDIKAQNVMREEGGRIVLMDFGLGQITGRDSSEFAGTLPYMAPELFEGAPATPQTDIYAVGVLVYYLVSGCFPINAPSVDGYRSAHRGGQRLELSGLRQGLPRRFVALVERACASEPARRYQTAGEMMTALLETSGAHGRTRRLRWLAAVVITALVVLGSAFEFWRRTDAPGEIQLALKPFTHDHGVTQDSTISEDGRMVAYTSDRDTKGSLELYIESTDSSHRRQLTFDGADKSEPSISPDGRWIAFRSESKGGGIYMMPMGGGERRSVAAGGRTARFSPNGTRIAFWTGDEGVFPHVPGRIFIVDTSGGASRQLVSDFVGARYPVWTSDGRHILFEGLRESGRSWDKSAEWWVLELDSGRVFPTGAQAALRSRGLTAFTMPSNFRGNSFVASARGEQATNLYKVDLLPDTWELANAPRQLTNGTGVLMSPWVSRSGQVVASNLEIAFNILRIPERRTLNEPLLRVTDNAYLNASPTVSRNGGWMTFSRSLGRMRDIWMMQLNTRQETLLAAGDAKYSIVLRPDGEEVAYSMNENGRHAIHLLSVKTRNDVRLCSACGDPTGWSPSLENLLVSNGSPGQIELLSTRGGDPTILLHRPGYELGEAQFSPDGGWIAFRAGLGGDRVRLYVAPYGATGAIPPQDWIPITEGEFWEDKPHWSTDGNTLYFESTRDNFTCLWSQKLEAVSRRPTGHPSTLVDFHTREFGPGAVSSESFNISVGGNYIFFNAADVRANVWSGSLSSTE